MPIAPNLVYVIDDDPVILESTEFLLHSLGYACRCFNGAESFLPVLDGLDPGCVITDLRMAEMNGDQLRAAMAEGSVGWPVILATAEIASCTAETAAKRGFSGFLRKPFSADALVETLHACFDSLEHRLT